MKFEEAMKLMRRGKKVTRLSWRNRPLTADYLFIDKTTRGAVVLFKTNKHQIIPSILHSWTVNNILADDWVEYVGK